MGARTRNDRDLPDMKLMEVRRKYGVETVAGLVIRHKLEVQSARKKGLNSWN